MQFVHIPSPTNLHQYLSLFKDINGRMFLTPGRKYQPAKESKPLADIGGFSVGARCSASSKNRNQCSFVSSFIQSSFAVGRIVNMHRETKCRMCTK